MQQALEPSTEPTLEKDKAEAQPAALGAESDKLQRSAEFLHKRSVEYTKTKATLSIYQAAPKALYDRVTAALTVHVPHPDVACAICSLCFTIVLTVHIQVCALSYSGFSAVSSLNRNWSGPTCAPLDTIEYS